MTTVPLLACRDVARTFAVRRGLFGRKRWLRAVDGVTLTVERGTVLALVGESGSGKTTLARMLLGLVPPSAGTILFDGAPLDGVDRRVLTRRVQPVFQDPYSSLNPRRTVAGIVAFPLEIHRIGTAEERRRRVADLLDMVGLPARVTHSYPHQLSGGQRQRVAIARALAIDPDLLICDEPTSALDISVQAQILNLLQSLRAELGLTYVLISHDLAVVDHMADRVAVMYLGRIVEEGPAERVLRAPRHPYTRALLASELTPDPSLGLPDPRLSGEFPDPLDPPAGCRFHPRCAMATDVCRREPPAVRADADGRVECHLAA
jgi:peptide/nickel transport system ATP-binding protein